MEHMESGILDRELKKGSAELLILSLLEFRARHGYEVGKLIEQRSGGTLSFRVASLYPLLYRLDRRGWIQGRWVEKAASGAGAITVWQSRAGSVLSAQKRGWATFIAAIHRITEAETCLKARGERRDQAPVGSAGASARAREAEIVEELSEHLEEDYQRALACGASEAEARRQVLEGLSSGRLLAEELETVEQSVSPEPSRSRQSE